MSVTVLRFCLPIAYLRVAGPSSVGNAVRMRQAHGPPAARAASPPVWARLRLSFLLVVVLHDTRGVAAGVGAAGGTSTQTPGASLPQRRCAEAV